MVIRMARGRKPVILENPFVVYNVWGDEENILWLTEDELDIRIEDILVGCIRALTAETTSTRSAISWQKLLRVYRNVQQLSRQDIETYLQCSKSQAKRYVQAIKLANPFIKRYMDGKIGSNVVGYPHVTIGQVNKGYLKLL